MVRPKEIERVNGDTTVQEIAVTVQKHSIAQAPNCENRQNFERT